MPHKRAKRSIRDVETAKKGVNLPPSASSYDDTPRSASRIFNAHAVQSAFRKAGRITSEDTGETKPKPYSSTTNSTSHTATKSTAKASTSTSTTSISTTNPSSSSSSSKGKSPSIPSIKPNESLGEYNRRVEDFLRPGVSKAIKDAASIKAAEEAKFRQEKKERKKRTRIERLVKLGKMPQSALDELKKEQDGKGKKRKRGDVGDDDDLDEDDENSDKEHQHGENTNVREEKSFKPLEGPRRLNDIVQAPPSLPHLRHVGQEKKVGKGVYGAVGKGSGKDPLNAGQRRILEEERERVVKMYRDMKAAREGAKEDGKGVMGKVLI
ncbi:hypothetical protein IAR55_002057 [Kwoniella newhampshirensis]|uniref:Uncharacterized protein n=1 Tax=Kwoniella newhampshirensis TaxID=1651941 RepID=A0AAW0Z0Q4_9TREE